MMITSQKTSSILAACQMVALAATITIQLNLAFGSPQQQPKQAPLRLTPIKPNNWSRCNVQTEFHCKLEDRCIALEQHCDFQEQCLDGEDELGCTPERCNFEHDHCYWLDSAFTSGHRHDFWRRFSQVSSGAKRSRKSSSKPEVTSADAASTSELKLLTKFAPQTSSLKSLGALLNELGSSQTNQSKFLFVPMTWTRPSAGSNHLWTRRAQIKAPPIGRTSSACQLRFEYAMLSSPSPAGASNASVALQLVASQKWPSLTGPSELGNNSIGLGRQVVWSHQVARQAHDSSQAHPSGLASAVEGADAGQRRLWAVGVAELGHLRNFELSFEAESSIWPAQTGGVGVGDAGGGGGSGPGRSGAKFNQVERGDASDRLSRSGEGADSRPASLMAEGQLARERNQPINYGADSRGRQDGAHASNKAAESQVASRRARSPAATTAAAAAAAAAAFEGALIAIRWLEFHKCHDWPPIRAEQVKAEMGDIFNEDVTNPNPDETLVMNPDESCPRDEFSCSLGSCLPSKLLCNFQDDCYSSNGKTSFAWPWPAGGIPTSDDESDDLCRNVLGRENFESTDSQVAPDAIRRESRQMQLYSTSRPDKFWHLTGTWPIGRVSIRRSNDAEQPITHLPSRDHTTRSAGGNFLSLEVPPWGSNGSSITYWASITSNWMQKLEAEAFGQCRLKFFLNFISPLLETRAGPNSAAPASGQLKLIVALEHVSLSNSDEKLERQRQQWPFGRQQPRLKRTVDTMLHSGMEFDTSQLETYNRSHSSIELAGLDFWREANFELADLKAGDFFQLRLVILIQIQSPSASSAHNQNEEPAALGSVNIDDMATHFGCGPIEDGRQLALLNNMALPFWQSAVPRLSDYVKQCRPNKTVAHRQQPLLKNKWDRFKAPVIVVPDEANYYDDEPSGQSIQFPSGGDDDDDDDDDNHHHHKLRRRLEQVPPHLLVVYVLCAFCLIIGMIALIVFVMVPHVERAMMQHQNQIQLSLSGEISDVPATTSPHSASSDFLSVSPSDSIRTGTLFGGALDHMDYETHFSGARGESITTHSDRSQMP